MNEVKLEILYRLDDSLSVVHRYELIMSTGRHAAMQNDIEWTRQVACSAVARYHDRRPETIIIESVHVIP